MFIFVQFEHCPFILKNLLSKAKFCKSINLGTINPFSVVLIALMSSYNWQGSKEIRQWPINQYTFSILIEKMIPSEDYN